MEVIHIGFDPGVTGALCMLTPAPDWRCVVEDLPTSVREGKKKSVRMVDAVALHAVLQGIVPASAKVLATVEDVFSIPGMNTRVQSSDSLVQSRSCIETVCRMLGYTVANVRPQTWQKFYGLKGGDKKLSMGTAQRLYPAAPLTLVKHHNRAEAVLIAHWARRNAA